MKRIVFTVTNGLNHDQRMIRIGRSLTAAGYRVTLVGVSNSEPLQQQPFEQKRLAVPFKKGFGFYAGYNIRLFFFLLFVKTDRFCCIDLDTMLPVWLASTLRGKPRVYDAHEFFSELKEVVSRPKVHRVWHWIEKRFLPRFPAGYTVSQGIADEFARRYGVHYAVIRNMPLRKEAATLPAAAGKIILYQGAVNEARGLEYLVPAMLQVPALLHIYGDGNFTEAVKELIRQNNLQDKVLMKGKLLPEALDAVTREAYIGINLVEHVGLNQYYSLANKFFDYIQLGVPQVTMNFPEYARINAAFDIALLIDDVSSASIAGAINTLLQDKTLHERLRNNCLQAGKILNWQEEEKKLLEFYAALDKKV